MTKWKTVKTQPYGTPRTSSIVHVTLELHRYYHHTTSAEIYLHYLGPTLERWPSFQKYNIAITKQQAS